MDREAQMKERKQHDCSTVSKVKKQVISNIGGQILKSTVMVYHSSTSLTMCAGRNTLPFSGEHKTSPHTDTHSVSLTHRQKERC